MILKEIQNRFHNELDELYGENEVDSFFYWLLEHYFQMNRLSLALKPQLTLTEAEGQPLFEALKRLKQYEPIQYIIGQTEFFGLMFKVNQNTLIPRPETEELVQWIIQYGSRLSPKSQLKILDIGTGTGCIAIALAKHMPHAKVFAVDISNEALKMAKYNANLNNVEVEFMQMDVLDENNWHDIFDVETKFDIIVSNPPYVRQQEKHQMKNNVLDYEPDLALFVEDHNPLVFYKAITCLSVDKLNPRGQLFFEINQYLGAEMKQMIKAFPFNNIELRKDIFGNDRMFKAEIL